MSKSICSLLFLGFVVLPYLAADNRPNIIVILADDMGYSDIGCYGGEIETPHIDALAENGLRFRQFYNSSLLSHTRFVDDRAPSPRNRDWPYDESSRNA